MERYSILLHKTHGVIYLDGILPDGTMASVLVALVTCDPHAYIPTEQLSFLMLDVNPRPNLLNNYCKYRDKLGQLNNGLVVAVFHKEFEVMAAYVRNTTTNQIDFVSNQQIVLTGGSCPKSV